MKRKQKKYDIKRGQLFSGISQANNKYKYVIVFDLGQIKRSTVTKKRTGNQRYGQYVCGGIYSINQHKGK